MKTIDNAPLNIATNTFKQTIKIFIVHLYEYKKKRTNLSVTIYKIIVNKKARGKVHRPWTVILQSLFKAQNHFYCGKHFVVNKSTLHRIKSSVKV